MPGIKRYGINQLRIHLEPLIAKGLASILIFGTITDLPKVKKKHFWKEHLTKKYCCIFCLQDNTGSSADSAENPVVRALPKLRKWFPNVVLTVDVCLCPYTDHGHCGVLLNDELDNALSIERLAAISLAYAQAGAQVIAPSDMMDNRIAAIKKALAGAKLDRSVAVLSYAAKFASCFYGPFREAAKSKPGSGDRKSYQLPPGSKGMAARAVVRIEIIAFFLLHFHLFFMWQKRDVEEGADMLMVKPGLPYLDIVRQTKDAFPDLPLFIYQVNGWTPHRFHITLSLTIYFKVSGEYSMLYNGNPPENLRAAVWETLICMRRAGLFFFRNPKLCDIVLKCFFFKS